MSAGPKNDGYFDGWMYKSNEIECKIEGKE